MPLILRSQKSEPLTNNEVDNNFLFLQQGIDTNASNLATLSANLQSAQSIAAGADTKATTALDAINGLDQRTDSLEVTVSNIGSGRSDIIYFSTTYGSNTIICYQNSLIHTTYIGNTAGGSIATIRLTNVTNKHIALTNFGIGSFLSNTMECVLQSTVGVFSFGNSGTVVSPGGYVDAQFTVGYDPTQPFSTLQVALLCTETDAAVVQSSSGTLLPININSLGVAAAAATTVSS